MDVDVAIGPRQFYGEARKISRLVQELCINQRSQRQVQEKQQRCCSLESSVRRGRSFLCRKRFILEHLHFTPIKMQFADGRLARLPRTVHLTRSASFASIIFLNGTECCQSGQERRCVAGVASIYPSSFSQQHFAFPCNSSAYPGVALSGDEINTEHAQTPSAVSSLRRAKYLLKPVLTSPVR
jgi:hypothetical protein